MRRSSLTLVAVTLLAVVGTSFYSQGQAQNQAPPPARSRADETLAMWNSIGNKLIAMAQDFKKDTISSCRKTSAPLPKLFSTSSGSITS
jgi:hypothetical protein